LEDPLHVPFMFLDLTFIAECMIILYYAELKFITIRIDLKL